MINTNYPDYMKKYLFSAICLWLLAACGTGDKLAVTPSDSDLSFDNLAATWDEGMPLGNATVGALVWQRDSALRFSLDRTDLWDLRPMDSISGPNNRFAWVREQVKKGDYLPVQKKYDWPYDQQPAPSKIPGAALEFSLEQLGSPSAVRLYLNNALCEASWADGTVLKTFVHATKPIGWFVFENLQQDITPSVIPPTYNNPDQIPVTGPEAGPDLGRLGYKQGIVTNQENGITYHQEGWNGFSYDVTVRWERKGTSLVGVWSLTSSLSKEKATQEAEEALARGTKADYQSHLAFWKNYWDQSSVKLPDPILQKQYDNEMYKYGSATREDSYPISLQAVWTADNGKLPPWKGDYHHDLNTQLSYWPTYIGNHLTEGLGYLNTLWNQRGVYKEYTRLYFETDGMNVPGVCALDGKPMGGWIQYSMSQTASAWLAQHFYLHWKYSADRTFLEERAYPFLKDVATFLEQISIVDDKGVRTLTMSSSPEIYDNSIRAWFKDMTNYDLSLMQFAFKATAELATELQLADEAAHWQTIGNQLPPLEIDAESALVFAKGFPYDESHRHFSHAMAIHPLGLIDWSDGEASQAIIKSTLKKLQDYGPDYWTGYSYSWFANMKARAFDGEGAAQELRTFAECFCLRNTFHVNGDQTKSGKSKYTYRPFTLEGNFAFASAIQEMLLQSHTGIVHLFPAIPAAWKNVSFDKLRAMGAFVISAERKEGELSDVTILAEQGGTLRLAWPSSGKPFTVSGADYTFENDLLLILMEKGQTIKIN